MVIPWIKSVGMMQTDVENTELARKILKENNENNQGNSITLAKTEKGNCEK